MDIFVVAGRDGTKQAIAVVASRESKQPLDDAVKLVETTLVETTLVETTLVETTLVDAAAVATHEKAWQTFWSRSGVSLADPALQNWWYRTVYFFRTFARPGGNVIGLIGGIRPTRRLAQFADAELQLPAGVFHRRSDFPELGEFGVSNSMYDILWIKYTLNAAKQAAQVMGNPTLAKRCAANLAAMPDYPTVMDPSQGGPVIAQWQGSPLAGYMGHGNEVMPLFPGDEVTWVSSPEQKLFTRTIRHCEKIFPHINSNVTIKSTVGGPVAIANPWPDAPFKVIAKSTGAVVPTSRSNSGVTFATTAGETSELSIRRQKSQCLEQVGFPEV